MTTKFKKSDYQAASPILEKYGKGSLTFGGMMEAIRLGEEKSQVEMAKRLKISRSHLCDIEKGRKTVSPARAVRFAKTLGYSEKLFISLALQDLIVKDKLNFKVSVEAA